MRSSELIYWLTDARRRTLELWADLTDEQMKTPLLSIINPPIWEIGHVAWFQEKWVLRHLRGESSVRSDADSLWDSMAIPHDSRWELPLPSRAETRKYMQDVLDRVIDRLPKGEVSDGEAYFHWLVVMHEDMHAEAFTYTRQTLGFPPPAPSVGDDSACQGTVSSVLSIPPEGVGTTKLRVDRKGGGEDVLIPGGRFLLGATQGEVFVFDNEKWAHEVKVPPFAIGRRPVTNGQFAEFVGDGGYRRRELWGDEGWTWREKSGAEHPVYWVHDGKAGWSRRHFDRVVPLGGDLPVIHVNWYEATAYCRWAGRRLPTEAEWEMAASAECDSQAQLAARKRKFPWGDQPPTPDRAHLDGRTVGCSPVGTIPTGDSAFGCGEMIGNVWEWTAAEFGPYPGFVVDPYKEYSEPWFGPQYRVLRGGCWATRSRLIRNTWRNFYTKDRRDVFAGFRTCAL